jgi:Secretion system C-terminal sorting domain
MKYRLLIILILIISFFSNDLLADETPEIGVNLTGRGVFVNIVNHSARYIDASGYDDLGWPQSDFEMVLHDGRPVAEWSGDIDDPEVYRIDYSGTYHACFTGTADISISGSGATIENKTYDANENKTFFDIVVPGPPAENHGFLYLKMTNTQRTAKSVTNSGINEFVVNRPGYPLDDEKIFTDEYLELCRAANFACYRYYGIQNIWGIEPTYPETTKWENRKTAQDAAQVEMPDLNGKKDTWCWEYVIEFANILDRDIWICLPISADSNYVVSLAKMLKDDLNPGIKIYVENSNEVWSPHHMTHGPYNQAQADHYGISFDQNYARRTVDLVNWFAEVYGKSEINNKIRVILAGQQAYMGRHEIHLDYINDNYGSPKDYVYALSTAIYFSTSNPNGTVTEINDGMIEEINGQINDEENPLNRKAHIDLANEWELLGGCTVYEGGPHYPAGGGKDNLDNAILSHRTEAMGGIMKLNFKEGWADLGGGLAMVFNLEGAYTRYGSWGLTDDYTKPFRNYKMQAIVDLIGTWTSVEEIISEDDLISKVYPNPFQDKLTIEFSEPISTKAKLMLSDMMGNTISLPFQQSQNNSALSVRFDESQFPVSGMYIVILEIEGKKSFIKVVHTKK